MKGIKTTLDLTVAVISMLTLLVLPATAIISLPAYIVFAMKAYTDITCFDSKNTVFKVSKKGRISQTGLVEPLRTLKLMKSKDKQEAFKEEIVSMFVQLQKENKKGEDIKYNTNSHSLTLAILRDAQRQGFIKDLEYKKAAKKRLLIPKLLMGNYKTISKKTQTFDISFTLTDKERNSENILNILNRKNVNNTNTSVNTNTLEKEEKIEKSESINLENDKEKSEETLKYMLLDKQAEDIINNEEMNNINENERNKFM